MKTKLILTAFAIGLATLNSQLSTLHAQGALTPPGAPAPTMKSLDQIEARTPLVSGQPGVSVSASGEITITASGSYYLTKNLVSTNTAASCINVGTFNVALDLNGYTITRTNGTEANTSGILISGVPNQMVSIRNGFIVGGGTNAGFAAAINTTASTDGSVHVENVHCTKVRDGIVLNYEEARNSAHQCSVETSGAEGIRAEAVTDCTVRNTVGTGIFASTVSGCVVRQENASFPGKAIGRTFSPNVLGSVMNSVGVSYADIGIQAGTVVNSQAATTTGTSALSATVANNCIASRTAGTAINATVANGCYALSGTNNIANKYNMP
jgi:hypothetical protein